jgi:hypothetical protein
MMANSTFSLSICQGDPVDTNLLILLVVVLLVILFAGSMLFYRGSADGEINVGPIHYRFKGSSKSGSGGKQSAAHTPAKKLPAHTYVGGVKVDNDAHVRNETGKSTAVVDSEIKGSLTVTSSSPTPAAPPVPPKPKSTKK